MLLKLKLETAPGLYRKWVCLSQTKCIFARAIETNGLLVHQNESICMSGHQEKMLVQDDKIMITTGGLS